MKQTCLFKLALPVAVLALASSGCKTVVRENIISSINTGIGISLAENPKTELYEAKIGYIRSQFYSVPTGKTVERDKNACCGEHSLSNDAHKTPNIVSGIRFNSDLRHLMLGATIAENFAVGDLAVNSPAAVAMYVGDAKSPVSAEAAARAVSDSYLKDSAGDCLRGFWKPDGANANTNNAALLTQWMATNRLDTSSITLFLRGSKYKELRPKAIKDLNINCGD